MSGTFLKRLLAGACILAGTWLSGVNLGYLYPAGAQAGTTVQIIIGGQGLWGYNQLFVTGGGVTLVRLQYAPGTFYAGCGEQYTWVREYLNEVANGGSRQPLRNDRNFGVWRYPGALEQLDQLDPLMFSLACKGVFDRPNSLQASPAIAQKLVATLRIAPDAAPGVREFRLLTAGGNLRATNPLRFYIGKAPEFREQNYQLPPLKRKPVLFTIPSAVNGQIEPGETDHFKFKLSKGEKVYFALKGRILNPYIGDGVPGNFQPVLEIKDETGKSLAFADDNYFDPDPILNFTAPADGLYTLEIRDALYRGREDFVYRIDAVRGTWRRPALARPCPDLPEYCEHAAAAQKVVKLPLLISGTVSKPGEVKKFCFRAEKNQQIAAEVFARRLGSPLDSLLKILGPDGKVVACNDDFPRPNFGLNMQHVDSFLCFKAPASGVYQAVLSDTAGAGGEDYGFFLRLDRPRPDFRVYVVPSAVPVSMDHGADQVTVVAERMDGFKGEIFFELKDAANITIAGINSIPPGAAESIIAFSASWIHPSKNVPVFPELYAYSGSIRHRVGGADSAMQAFAYTHYIPARRLLFLRCWLHGNADRFKVDPKFAHRLTLKRGGSAEYAVNYLPVKPHMEPRITFSLDVKGVTLKTVRKGDTFRLVFTAAKDAPVCAMNTAVKVNYVYKYRERNGNIRTANNTFFLPPIRLTVR